MQIEFTFRKKTPCFRWTSKAGGTLEPDGYFFPGKQVTLSAVQQKRINGEMVLTFELWSAGNPYHFDPTEAGLSPEQIADITKRLQTYEVGSAAK